MTCRQRAAELRAREDRHYNCCQSVLVPFGEENGLDHEELCRLTVHFGGGMRRGAVCGAVTGGLMALGLSGTGEETALEFQRRFEERAGGMDCSELLRLAEERGEERKHACDALVDLAVGLVEELIR